MVSLRSGISPAGVFEIFGLSFASVYLLCVYRTIFYVEPQIQLIRLHEITRAS